MSLAEGFSWEAGIIGISLSLFTLANILTKSYKHKTDWLLCLWLVLLNVPFMHAVLSHLKLDFPALYLYTNPALNLLNGPLLYFYVRMLTGDEGIRVQRSDLFHFLPFGLFYFLFILMSHSEPMMPQPEGINSGAAPVAENAITALFGLLLSNFGLINVLFFIGYSAVTVYMLNRHQKNITGIFSQNDNQVSLKWIYALPGLFAVLVMLNVVVEKFTQSGTLIDPLTLHLLSFLCFVVLLCFFGVKQKPVFQFRQEEPEPEEEQASVQSEIAESDSEAGTPETENNGLSDGIIHQTIEQMQDYMNSEKPFLDPDFSVYVLADALNIPRRTLSQVLSAGLSKNFYQYVNEFRIEEVKVQLECQDEKTTILDIAFQAGFKSKSSFNSLFKQHCDLTPSQYRKKIKQT
ncbi:helix-turn-helix domain-containing protein [Vibrio sp. JC009]|uniref:helix-turn-helix domain-containing protein n=1 Tax=Vibrio sp. JC009 TaxID=2912314 RepID=UPI0023B014A4|nr:AraC family transcriptional regulator [Vibrio sp. JC009]WED24632.1 helix-turn-helix domain-containing protein [Vibrio sp. JC009]